MLIRICSFSKEGASKTKGLVLKEKLEKGIIQHERITVDFTGVDCYASPFFNNIISTNVFIGILFIKNL